MYSLSSDTYRFLSSSAWRTYSFTVESRRTESYKSTKHSPPFNVTLPVCTCCVLLSLSPPPPPPLALPLLLYLSLSDHATHSSIQSTEVSPHLPQLLGDFLQRTGLSLCHETRLLDPQERSVTTETIIQAFQGHHFHTNTRFTYSKVAHIVSYCKQILSYI